ncbi:hypothetical protein Cni_G09006 [Canna indica]|uniref:Uncharacterized protein n=1 Tax=Canna indica TaxID=4628 RepID=A0AAQ3K3V1_9LILI|nr:hypothetical protein Cni_G09006 [Canna indica]
MLEHPRHFVVDLRSLSASGIAKVTPLPADHLLQPDKMYAMLPMARGNAAGLSPDEARRVLATASRMLKLRSVHCSFLRALLRMRAVGPAEKGNKVAAGEERKQGGMAEEMEQRAEILMRQYSSKRWKPSLGTIVEKSFEKRVPHWLF